MAEETGCLTKADTVKTESERAGSLDHGHGVKPSGLKNNGPDYYNGRRIDAAASVEENYPELYARAMKISADQIDPGYKDSFWEAVEKACVLEEAQRECALKMLECAGYLDGRNQLGLIYRAVHFARKYGPAEIEKLIRYAFGRSGDEGGGGDGCIKSNAAADFWLTNGLDHLGDFDENTAYTINMLLIKFESEKLGALIGIFNNYAALIVRYGIKKFFKIVADNPVIKSGGHVSINHLDYIKKFGLESYRWITQLTNSMPGAGPGSDERELITKSVIALPSCRDYRISAGGGFGRNAAEAFYIVSNFKKFDENGGIASYIWKDLYDDLKSLITLEYAAACEKYGKCIAGRLLELFLSCAAIYNTGNDIDSDELHESIAGFIRGCGELYEGSGFEALERTVRIIRENYRDYKYFLVWYLNNLKTVCDNFEPHDMMEFVEIARERWNEYYMSSRRLPPRDFIDIDRFELPGRAPVKFRDARPRLEKYLNALSGRFIEIVAGFAPASNAEKIILPRFFNEFSDRETNWIACKAAATHEAEHIARGSHAVCAAELIEAVFGETETINDVGDSSGPAYRSGFYDELDAFYSKYAEPELMKALFNMLEDARIEYFIGREYPALALDSLRIKKEKALRVPPPSAYGNAKNRVVACAERILLYEEPPDENMPADELAVVEAVTEAAAILFEDASTVISSARTADMVYTLVASSFEGRFERREAFSCEIMKVYKDGGGGKEKGTKNKGAAMAENEKDGGGETSKFKRQVVETRAIRCGTGERDEPGRQAAEPVTLDRAMKAAIKKLFAGMKPERPVRRGRMKQGGEIDLDAFVDGAVETKRGCAGDGNIYIELRPARRDMAVMLLIDLSGSVCGKILKAEKTALLASCEALAAAGDRFSIIAYRTESGFCHDENLKNIFETVKSFGEPYGAEIRSAINRLKGDGGTPSGDALEFAAAKLAAVDAKNRLIIHLTDGMPDGGFLAGAGAAEVRHAVKKAAGKGIKTYCVTINPKMHEHMDKMYAAGNWVLVSDIEKLPEKMIRLYRRLAS